MLCPACGNILIEKQADGFIYYLCEKGCGGILINQSEAEEFLTQTTNITERILNVESSRTIRFVSSDIRYCPHCDKQEMKNDNRKGIGIKVCKKCGFIWLDFNEIKKLGEGLKTEYKIDDELERKNRIINEINANNELNIQENLHINNDDLINQELETCNAKKKVSLGLIIFWVVIAFILFCISGKGAMFIFLLISSGLMTITLRLATRIVKVDIEFVDIMIIAVIGILIGSLPNFYSGKVILSPPFFSIGSLVMAWLLSKWSDAEFFPTAALTVVICLSVNLFLQLAMVLFFA